MCVGTRTFLCMKAHATRLRLKTAEFDTLARAVLGQQSDAKLAARLGVGATHYSQLRTGRRNPGSAFIAAVKTAMPNVPFEHIFEVVDGDGAAANRDPGTS